MEEQRIRRLETGKLPSDLLREILAEFGLPPEVRLGPRIGEDAAAIDVERGTLVAATDPITLTGKEVGAHAVAINANDVAVMGVSPRWFLATVLLPEGTDEAEVRALFSSMREALDAVGAALVGGHTEVTAAVTQAVVVGQMLGLAQRGRVIETGALGAGDIVLQIGPAPVEAASVLAGECRERLRALDEVLLEQALAATRDPGISVVEPALAAAELGACAMHDPTEGGLAAGLHELADASGVALSVDESAVEWFAPGVAVCEALGVDAWGALASGALLAGFPAERAQPARRALRARGWTCALVARAEVGAGVRFSSGRALERFARDEVARVLGDTSR